MKTIKILVPLLFIIFGVSSSKAQNLRARILNTNVYRSELDLEAVRISDKVKNGKTFYNDIVTIKGPIGYEVLNEDDNGFVIFEIFPLVSLTKTSVQTNLADSTKANYSPKFKTVITIQKETTQPLPTDDASQFYYAVKKDKFKPFQKIFISSRVIGQPLIHPLKLRPNKGIEGWNLSGEFTLSYTIAYRFKLPSKGFNPIYLNIVPYGLGIGAGKYFTENKDGSVTEKKDSWSVTYYQAGAFATIKKVNIGFFVGLDAMIDKQKDWFYQGKPWFSLGFGYKFKND